MVKTTLICEIKYDPNLTDPEGLASAMDRLMETALSTPGIMDEYGVLQVGEFLVATEPGQEAEVQRRWVLYNPDTDALLTTRTYASYEDGADDASQVNDVLGAAVADSGSHRRASCSVPAVRFSGAGPWAVVASKSFDQYRYGPRSVLVPGDRFRATGGPVYITDDGRAISVADRGIFVFRRYCVQGSAKWIELTVAMAAAR